MVNRRARVDRARFAPSAGVQLAEVTGGAPAPFADGAVPARAVRASPVGPAHQTRTAAVRATAAAPAGGRGAVLRGPDAFTGAAKARRSPAESPRSPGGSPKIARAGTSRPGSAAGGVAYAFIR